MQFSAPDLELAVLCAQTGDQAAFAVVVRRCEGVFLRHARRFLGDAELARDAVQDAWIAIVRGLRRLEDPARFVPWALRIVAARALDTARRRQRSPARAGDVEAAVDGRMPEAAADEAALLRAAVAALDFDHRVVVELHHLDGLSVAEVADAIGLPVGTVKSRLFHARERLRSRLEDQRTRSET